MIGDNTNMSLDKKSLFPNESYFEEVGPRYQSVVLVGPPGVGKGTQGKLLSSIPGIFHLSSGDMFRELDENTDFGQLFHEYATRGDLVPDDITVKIWQEYISIKVEQNVYNPKSDLLVLDGIPRNLAQAELLSPYLDILKILFMVCEDREVMFERIRGRALKEKRRDDADELVVRYRWDLYKRDTEPMIDHFSQETVRIIDADTIPAAVLHQILSALVPIQKNCFSPPHL